VPNLPYLLSEAHVLVALRNLFAVQCCHRRISYEGADHHRLHQDLSWADDEFSRTRRAGYRSLARLLQTSRSSFYFEGKTPKFNGVLSRRIKFSCGRRLDLVQQARRGAGARNRDDVVPRHAQVRRHFPRKDRKKASLRSCLANRRFCSGAKKRTHLKSVRWLTSRPSTSRRAQPLRAEQVGAHFDPGATTHLNRSGRSEGNLS
jgi:hypothetical protein